VIINNTVYDITDFVDSHPGGSGILLKYAGRDATEAFEPLHRADTLESYLTSEYVYICMFHMRELVLTLTYASQNLGPVSIEDHDISKSSKNIESKTITLASKKVGLSSIICIADFGHAASQNLPLKSFACECNLQAMTRTILIPHISSQNWSRGRICHQLESK
jgi:L-lactate dehydrogenase (cytochrome)